MSDKLVITQYTDPMCIWCLAMEPAMRKIRYLGKDRVEFHNVMGLLVGDAKEIIGDDASANIRFQSLRKQMTAHFLDASARSGMPVSVVHMESIKPEDITSIPMSLAFEAAKLIDEETANRFLRRMRESAHMEDRGLSNLDAIKAIVVEMGIDAERYQANLDDGSAQAALESDIAACRSRGVRSFPTTLMEFGGKQVVIQGFQEYGSIKHVIDDLTDGEFTLEDEQATDENIADYILQYGRVAPKEIEVAFSVGKDETEEAVGRLVDSGAFEKLQRGNGYLVQAKSMMCDSQTGVCSF